MLIRRQQLHRSGVSRLSRGSIVKLGFIKKDRRVMLMVNE